MQPLGVQIAAWLTRLAAELVCCRPRCPVCLRLSLLATIACDTAFVLCTEESARGVRGAVNPLHSRLLMSSCCLPNCALYSCGHMWAVSSRNLCLLVDSVVGLEMIQVLIASMLAYVSLLVQDTKCMSSCHVWTPSFSPESHILVKLSPACCAALLVVCYLPASRVMSLMLPAFLPC